MAGLATSATKFAITVQRLVTFRSQAREGDVSDFIQHQVVLSPLVATLDTSVAKHVGSVLTAES